MTMNKQLENLRANLLSAKFAYNAAKEEYDHIDHRVKRELAEAEENRKEKFAAFREAENVLDEAMRKWKANE